tara:strand:- start:7731 stop:8981 length:1251 start_codon:yes stop_codon:yes gene_type:complete
LKEETRSASPQWSGVDPHEFSRLIRRGKLKGQVSLDEILEVLRDAELAPSLVSEVRETLENEGISLDDTVVEKENNESSEGEAKITRPPKRSLKRRLNKKKSSEQTGSSDSTQRYLSEIGEVALLEAEEETSLAKEIREGMEAETQLAELHATGELENLSRVDLSRLRRRQRRGEQARDRLTRANLRLVVSIAKRYVGRGLPLLDLVQEGNLGLMRAVEKFDGTKGYKFSTYATWWIRQSVSRAVSDQGRTIRIPVHTTEAMNRVVRAERELTQELERAPTIEEIGERAAVDPKKVDELLQLGLSQGTLSLDLPMGEEGEVSLADILQDFGTEAPESVATQQVLTGEISEVLDSLEEREKQIVQMRFGLDGTEPKTLEEVGKHFKVTRERVRQIEIRILNKLRHQQRSKTFREYLD